MRWPLIAAFALALVGCKQDYGQQRELERDVFYQEPPAEVDILWVVDNSNSMEEEQEELGARFDAFITHMDEENTEIDFHIGVLTTDMDADNEYRGVLLGDPYVLDRDTPDYKDLFRERVAVGTDGSDMERGLEAAFTALTEPMISEANEGFLRPDATLSIIFVSDENDCSDRGALPADANGTDCYSNTDLLVPVKDYISEFEGIKEDASLVISSAIVGPEVTEGCDNSWPGTRYLSVAENMGGLQGDICDKDFTNIMDELGLNAAGVHSSFGLSYRAVEGTIELYVDDDLLEEGTDSGWSYNDETCYITFDQEHVPPRGSVITVEYENAGNCD